MLKSFIFLLRFFLFWLLFFFLERLVFLVYFSDKLQSFSFKEIVTSFAYGLRLDASMAGYLSTLPLLIFLVLWIFARIPFKAWISRTYVTTLIILFSLLTVINFNIYREWGSKLNSKALDFFFTSTNEAIASSASAPILLSIIVLILLMAAGIALSRYLIDYKIPRERSPIWAKGIAGVFFLSLIFLAIRGGLDASPINQSMAYYSDKPILNHAAINTEWNLVRDLMKQNFSNENPYKYYPNEQAASIVKELYKPEDDLAPEILNIPRPNIVFVLLESFTADVVESLGGEKGVAPNMEKLIAEGLLFDHIYASGDRTDKGLVAILSAFPSQATRSIIKFNDKQEKLPALSQALKTSGYHTSFYYGGQSEFFNIKSYLLSHGITSLTDKADFEKAQLSSWGVFDHLVFKRNVEDLKTFPQPFFSTVLTLSNHEPFQLPDGKAKFPGEESENKFRSTAYYTDASLGQYLKDAKNESWYKNTLFVILADHGHRLPKNSYEIYDPGRFRIPLLFFGDALKPEFKGKTISRTGNQTDIAATLLNQLNLPHHQFKWSNDLLNPQTSEFSFFSWDDGFGFANKEQVVSFDNVSKKVIYRKDPANLQSDSTMLRYGKAYMQQVFQAFLDY